MPAAALFQLMTPSCHMLCSVMSVSLSVSSSFTPCIDLFCKTFSSLLPFLCKYYRIYQHTKSLRFNVAREILRACAFGAGLEEALSGLWTPESPARCLALTNSSSKVKVLACRTMCF